MSKGRGGFSISSATTDGRNYYDERYYRFRDQIVDTKTEVKITYRLLRPERDSRILEVGCGSGSFLSFLERKGHRAVGVDISEIACALARETVRGSEVLVADACSLPFEDDSFDRLAAIHVIEHIDDLAGALKEWKRVLRPGSVVAVCAPNKLYSDREIFHDPGHVRVDTLAELREAFESCGFKVERTITIFPDLGPRAVSLRIGVPAYRLFIHLPYFKERGRSIVLSASLP